VQEPAQIGQRVRLRAVAEDDLARVRAWLDDPGIRDQLTIPFLEQDLREADWVAALCQDRGAVHFAIVLCQDERHIGNCGLHGIDAGRHEAQFGILIGDRTLWGKGYGTEAARLTLAYGFGELHLGRICLRVAVGNERARRVYEKAGFLPEDSQGLPRTSSQEGRTLGMVLDAARWQRLLRACF